ncbi:MAG: hypothetical protein JWO31_4109, partial [Phycisphaerales bacterium]|nr:hypothetical protein [Phycisphaerales bacterium]
MTSGSTGSVGGDRGRGTVAGGRRSQGRRFSPGRPGWATAAAAVLLGASAAAVAAAKEKEKPAAPAAKPAAAPATKPAAPARPAFTATGRPFPVPVPPDPTVLTDAMIDNAIRQGSDWLLKQFDPKTHVVMPGEKAEAKGDQSFEGGLQALAVYALLQSGLAIEDKRLELKNPDMLARVDALIKFNLSNGSKQTYAYGLRSTALALFVSQIPDPAEQKADTKGPPAQLTELQQRRQAAVDRLIADAQWCVMATKDGGYHYVKGSGTPTSLDALAEYYTKLKASGRLPTATDYDNSTSQYGLLGAWSAAEAGVKVPIPYWDLVTNHWRIKQLSTGQWEYESGKGATTNMTTAGVASALVAYEYSEMVANAGSVGKEPYNATIKKGLAWLEKGNNGISAGNGYGYYGVERVGLASGYKFFGANDWYRYYARKLVDIQAKAKTPNWPSSAFYGEVPETAYNLLFLSRGRHPILMNKLRFDGDGKTPTFWANRPQDAAALAKTVSKQIEKPLNWQVVNVASPWEQWTDGPILTLASHVPVKFSDGDLEKIRSYVEAGGILYTQADGGSPAFDRFAHQLCKDLFKRELTAVPANHPLYTNESVFRIQPPVPLKMATNGSRVLMVHSNVDLAKSWQARDDGPKAAPHQQLAVNLFTYANGKLGYRNRL